MTAVAFFLVGVVNDVNNVRFDVVAGTRISCYHVPLGNASLLHATRYLSRRSDRRGTGRIVTLSPPYRHPRDRFPHRQR
jgi:hypothetical protein